ncbi:MAG TPA: IS110 family transposase [Candidatus Acidoferrales bacterium]|nr:IS110 family transposase [Candidatus Acidoferrales bacterium]
MEVLYPCCCGLDVHKKSITACVLWAEEKGKSRKEKRRFGTFTQDLLRLADWLRECGVTHVAMESTGVYWKPVWNILEGQFEVLLVNAQHIKAVPGRKTDQKDSEWIGDLLQHGLLRASFVPPRPTRELRDLTRYRVSLTQEINRIANRVQKVLEDANIKLASVATDALGASGRAMLEAMLAGEQDSMRLAEMSQGKLRNKIPELRLALEGRMSEHHRFLLRQLYDHLLFTEGKLREIEQEIARRMCPFEEEVARLRTIPGVDRVTAWGLLAEIGLNMNQFPSAAHLASGACLCPGSSESAGKRLSGKMRKGNVSLRRCLAQAAWAISMTKNNYLSALYRRIAARRGAKRAVMAVAHALLVIAYHMLKRGENYRELGADHFDRIDVNRIRRSLVRRLERLGHKVTLEPVEQTA